MAIPDTTDPVISARAQPLVAAVTALCLLAAASSMLASGVFSGGLVDHERPPQPTLSFTVDVNSATAVELAQLPGLGPATARRLVDHRREHGAFASIESLLDVPGIGEATLEQMRPHLRPIQVERAEATPLLPQRSRDEVASP
jgi:competence ComEA-like helix-hairpin-helix protein